MISNPLLELSTLPNHAPPFDKIEINHFLPAIESGIATAHEKIAEIKANPLPADFDNTIVALETVSEDLGYASGIFYNYLSVIGGNELQTLAEQIGPVMAKFGNDVLMDQDIFARVRDVYERRQDFDLTPEQQTLLEDSYKDFVRGGALLDADSKARLREISHDLSILHPTFMNNVKKSTEAFEMRITDQKDLEGLPESAVQAARHTAQEKGYDGAWLFTLDMPSYIPFIQYAENTTLREKIWRAYASRAWRDDFDNSENVRKIVALRQERAQLLGYENHAAFVLEERMAKAPQTVFDFLDRMKDAYRPAAENDLATLRDFARERDEIAEIKPWDVAYYSEKLKEKLFDFSSEDFRPYFPLDKVLNGTFEHFSRLFGLKFQVNEQYPVWHPDVRAFDVVDKESGRFIGTFYADFYPRTGKNQGAWKSGFRSQGLFRGKVERPVVTIVCNFTKPMPDKPSLLTHNEVLTLFHEMGHAVHALLSDVTYPSLAGTSVLWDFVELPSQVQENWCYEKETLDMLSAHFETGEHIPADLIEKLRRARVFMQGMAGLRQVALGLLDMRWHTADMKLSQDVDTFEDDAIRDVTLFPRLAGPISPSFSHVFAGGYAAGYYSYKWAEVLDADTFALFESNGLYDAETAARYKNEILSRGGSEDPSILYKRFRGRDPDADALLRREGLLKAA